MAKALPYGRVYFNDLLGECVAEGLGLRARGILFTLFWAQHMTGSIPADLRSIRRLLGEDVEANDIRAVVDSFFPVFTEDRKRRMNSQHAEARAEALELYEKQKRGGKSRQAQLRAERSSANWTPYRTPGSTPDRPPVSNHNQTFPSPHLPPLGMPRKARIERG